MELCLRILSGSGAAAINKHDTQIPEDVRLDKWLWAARFFKTRALATKAVEGGKVHVNGTRAKPSKPVHVGDEVRIHREQYEYVISVRGTTSQRRSAPEAALLYEESKQSKQARTELAAQLRMEAAGGLHAQGRPSKRDRRHILQFKQKNR